MLKCRSSLASTTTTVHVARSRVYNIVYVRASRARFALNTQSMHHRCNSAARPSFMNSEVAQRPAVSSRHEIIDVGACEARRQATISVLC